jgi:hypothetical protein
MIPVPKDESVSKPLSVKVVETSSVEKREERAVQLCSPVPADEPRALDEPARTIVPARRKPVHQPPVIEPPVASPNQRGCLATCALFGGLSLLILTITFAAILFAFTQSVTNFFGDAWDGARDLFGIGDGATPEVVDTQVIVLGIRHMSVLQTTSGDILIEKEVVQEKTSLLKDAKLRIRYIGRATAGIDLAQITDQSVTVGPENHITIELPPAQITGCYLRDPEILENSCGTSFLGVADCSDTYERLQDKAYERAIGDLLDTAQELNLAEQAYQSAEATIADLLRDLGYSTDSVSFTRRNETLPPDDSCLAP